MGTHSVSQRQLAAAAREAALLRSHPPVAFPSRGSSYRGPRARSPRSLAALVVPGAAGPPLDHSIPRGRVLPAPPRRVSRSTTTATTSCHPPTAPAGLAEPTLTKSSISGSFDGRLSIPAALGTWGGGPAHCCAEFRPSSAARSCSTSRRAGAGAGARPFLPFLKRGGAMGCRRGGGSCGASQL